MTKILVTLIATFLFATAAHASGGSAPGKLKQFESSNGAYTLNFGVSGSDCPETTILHADSKMQLLEISGFRSFDLNDWNGSASRARVDGDTIVFETFEDTCGMCSTLDHLENYKEEWIEQAEVTVSGDLLRIVGGSTKCVYKRDSN